MKQCPHCNSDINIDINYANHVRWCNSNPKAIEYRLKAANKEHMQTMALRRIESGNLNGYCNPNYCLSEEAKEKLRQAFTGRTLTEESKKIISEKALASKHRRLRRKMIEYNGVMLDSTWELELAKRLDSLNIKWVRPEPLPWTDLQGKTHNYFPDFYLVDYGLYLDPKNSYAMEVQQQKLNIICKMYNIKILTTLDECKSFSIT
jgi:hypothetical protein